MNNDLANFIVEFTTKGFKEVRDDIKELGDKLDQTAEKMNKVKGSGDGFLSFIGGLETKILALGTAIAGLGIKEAFDIKNESLNLQQLSMDSGVAAQNIEALGLALKFAGVGGDINTAGQFYRNLQDFREKMMRGEISESQAKEWAISGLKLNPAASLEQYIWDISQALVNLDNAGKTAKLNLLAQSVGLSDPMKRFLSAGPQMVVNRLKEAGLETWRYRPDVADTSAELNKNWEKFKNNWKEIFSDEWLSATNNLVKVLNDLLPDLKILINHLGGEFGKDIKSISEIVKTMNGEQTLGDLTKKLGENQEMAKSMGEVVGMALGAIIGMLIGHPVFGALIGRQVGGNIANLLWKRKNPDKEKEITDEDWNNWLNFGRGNPITKEQYDRLKERLPSWMHLGDFQEMDWVAGMRADLYGKQIGTMKKADRPINANTLNIMLDPTKTTDMTMNPDGTWTVKDGRGMTILDGVL